MTKPVHTLNRTFTYTHPHIRNTYRQKSVDKHSHTLQNPYIQTPTHFKTYTYTHTHTHTHKHTTLQNPYIHISTCYKLIYKHAYIHITTPHITKRIHTYIHTYTNTNLRKPVHTRNHTVINQYVHTPTNDKATVVPCDMGNRLCLHQSSLI